MIRYAFRLACANLKRTQNVTLPFFIASTVTVFLHFLIMTMMFNPHVQMCIRDRSGNVQ